MSSASRFLLSASFLAASFGSALRAQTVEAIADTYLQLDGKGTQPPFGSSRTLATGNDGGSFGLPKEGDRFFIIRFAVSDLPLPLSGARLVLQKISGHPAEFIVFGVPDLGADELFDEATYSFDKSAYSATTDNLADTNDGGLNRTSLINLGGFPAASGATPVSFTSTELVNFINGDTNGFVTLVVWQATQTKDTRLFASREHATLDGPSLVGSANPDSSGAIPEPSSYTALTGPAALDR